MFYEIYNEKVGAVATDRGDFVEQQVRPAAPPIFQLDSASLWLFRRRRDRGILVSHLHLCPFGDAFPPGLSALSWGGISLGARDGYP